MPFPKVVLLAAAVSIAGCAEATFEPTHQPGDVRLSRFGAEQYEVRDLGTFAGLPTVGFDMDKHGAVYGRYGNIGVSERSYRWTEANGYEDLGDIDGAAFRVLAANDHGLLNGSILTPAGQRAVAWVPQNGFVFIDPGFFGNSINNNERGVVAGVRFTSPGIQQAFVWSEKDGLYLLPVMVDDAEILRSAAAAVNDRGIVAGAVTFRRAGVVHNQVFIWDETAGTTLVPPLGPMNGVTDISAEGLVVGASQTRRPMPGETPTNPIASIPGTIPVRAWKWSVERGLVPLATLGGNHSVAWKADREGNVYGWASDAAGVQHAVKWPAAGGIIDLGGLGGNTATGGLNKHGVVAGWSTGNDGVAHAVIFTPRK